MRIYDFLRDFAGPIATFAAVIVALIQANRARDQVEILREQFFENQEAEASRNQRELKDLLRLMRVETKSLQEYTAHAVTVIEGLQAHPEHARAIKDRPEAFRVPLPDVFRNGVGLAQLGPGVRNMVGELITKVDRHNAYLSLRGPHGTATYPVVLDCVRGIGETAARLDSALPPEETDLSSRS